MPLPLPQLDNQTFDGLLSESRTLIPRYAPGWTDHNAHDPGITLLELFAWLAEQNIYRLDRIPDASFRSFLRLLGVEPRPAQVSETILTIGIKPSGKLGQLPSSLEINSADRRVTFQTTQDLFVSAAKLKAVLTGRESALVDRSSDNESHAKSYAPFGPQPEEGDALYLGFDDRLADPGSVVRLYVWTGADDLDRETWKQIEAEWHAVRDDAYLACPSNHTPDIADSNQHYSVQTVWEYYIGSGKWSPITGVIDSTRSLSLSGPVRFQAPAAHHPGGVNVAVHDSYYFFRCRVVKGSYDCAPEIRKIALNAVPARHAVDADETEVIGRSDGRAAQVFYLGRSPVVVGSTNLRVTMNGLDDGIWHEELTWDRVGPHDRAYVLVPETGEVEFGDGRRGRVPRSGTEIKITYQVGGGPSGNVGSDTLTGFGEGIYNDWYVVNQPFAATGGTAAESIVETKARALAILTRPTRAITLKDFEAIALKVPGIPVARAHAIADYDPILPCLPALGAVTVVIVPRCFDVRSTPGPEMLRAVQCYLERRRLITTELYVIAAEYRTVIVHARLHTERGTDSAKLVIDANGALTRFFHPLRGGSDGKGWPVGRDVYRAEILALLNELPGVLYVDEVSFETEEKTYATNGCCEKGTENTLARCGNVQICRHSLILSGKHIITVIQDDAPESTCKIPTRPRRPSSIPATNENRRLGGTRSMNYE